MVQPVGQADADRTCPRKHLQHRPSVWRRRRSKEGAIPQPRRWRIKSLRLRGSIGIWRGGGGDEIAIDFDDYDAGLVGLVGSATGAGKTTLLENLTPWPTMLTRSGPLQDHFRLRDSVRELRAGR